MITNCRATFSLMRKHVCAFGKQSHLASAGYIDGAVPNGVPYGNKRKASGVVRDDHAGKRMRTMDPDVMDIEGASPARAIPAPCILIGLPLV